MLLDCVVAGDDFAIEDLLDWRANSYATHFTGGGLADRGAIVRAYRRAPQLARRRLDTLSAELAAVAVAGAAFIAACRRAGADDSIPPMARHLAADIRRRLSVLESLVRLDGVRTSNSEVSVLFARYAA